MPLTCELDFHTTITSVKSVIIGLSRSPAHALMTHKIFRSAPTRWHFAEVFSSKLEVDPLCYFRKFWTWASSLFGERSTYLQSKHMVLCSLCLYKPISSLLRWDKACIDQRDYMIAVVPHIISVFIFSLLIDEFRMLYFCGFVFRSD